MFFAHHCCRITINRVNGLFPPVLNWMYQLTQVSSVFIQTLESTGIKMLRFPGLESPGKRHRTWKTLEKS